uniref:Uncharacterized protein n=1 Tax=Arion vulgaris TaxID=1028688 RepID=A0A0B7BGM3_9EUPU
MGPLKLLQNKEGLQLWIILTTEVVVPDYLHTHCSMSVFDIIMTTYNTHRERIL